MSVTRDKNTGKWMSQIRVKDWTGKEIHKKKRGFNTKKEALQWERDFISQADGSLGMKFKDFVALYMKDADPRLRETTLANKHYLFNKKVLPYFGEMPINAIKPTDIRNWQNELINYRRPNGRGYSPTYLRTINNQLTAGADVKLMGDLDGDNNVTLSDLVKFRALSNENGYNNAADFNADGAVDFYDLVALNNFVASNHTVADYYEMLGIDINAEIEGYNYGDLDGDGDSDLLDAAAFKANFVAILNIASDYKTILGAANVDSILAAAKA